MKDKYAAGSIWMWRRDFNDGRGPVKKYFVFLADCPVTGHGLLAMTTSRGRRYHGQGASPCGLPANQCFRIEPNEEKCFTETTYVQFDNIDAWTRLQLAEIESAFLQHMEPSRFRALLKCASASDDIVNVALLKIKTTLSSLTAAYQAEFAARRTDAAAAKAKSGLKSVAAHGIVAVREWYEGRCPRCRAEFCEVSQVSVHDLDRMFAGSKIPPAAFIGDAELAFEMAALAAGDACTCPSMAR